MNKMELNKEVRKLQKKIDSYVKQEKRVTLQTFRVTKQGSLSPFLFRKVEKLDKPMDAIFTKKSNTISLVNNHNEGTFIFNEPSSVIESFFNKDKDYKLIFDFDGCNFYVAKKEDHDTFLNETKEQRKIMELKREALIKQADLIEEKIKKEFWEQYNNIPFKFAVGIKPVKSGYGENSCCNGANRATVYHIILDENINIGRLKREKGEYLCSQLNWVPYAEIEPYREDLPVITCKSCLKKLERFKS